MSVWLELDDSELDAAALQADITARAAQRRSRLGPVELPLATFGHVTPMPAPPDDQFAPNLYYHLQKLNELPPPDTMPELAASPATRLPLLGRLWRLVRAQAHNLTLFYVNRKAAYDSQVTLHLINTINELTQLMQTQQQEIEALRAELERLNQR